MHNLLFIVVAIAAGAINALQIALVGGITRSRGPFEATWISMLASLAGLATLLLLVTALGHKLELPRLMSSWTFVVISVVMTTSLIVSGRDLPAFYLLTGLTAIPYLLAASWAGPRIGLAVFFAAVVSGQLIGSVTLDHIGAFGADSRPIDLQRLLGVAALLAGVILIRGRW
jgi:uncharacterized membrane protein YdcZ (DUF606 family)